MTMPDAGRAFVEERKVTGYLLNDTHPQGRSKARFFRAFGFVSERWEEFADALIAQAGHGTLVSILILSDSTQYAVEDALTTPDERAPLIRTVWETRLGAPLPRLITAYPAR